MRPRLLPPSGRRATQLLLPCHSWKVKCQPAATLTTNYICTYPRTYVYYTFTVAFKQYRNLSNEVEDRPATVSVCNCAVFVGERNQSNCRADRKPRLTPHLRPGRPERFLCGPVDWSALHSARISRLAAG